MFTVHYCFYVTQNKSTRFMFYAKHVVFRCFIANTSKSNFVFIMRTRHMSGLKSFKFRKKLEFDVALMSRLYKCKNRLRNYFCVAPPARQIFFSNSVAAIFGFSRSTELVLGKYNFCLCICMNQRSESIFVVKEITIYWNSVFNWALDILRNLDNPKTCFTKYVHILTEDSKLLLCVLTFLYHKNFRIKWCISFSTTI